MTDCPNLTQKEYRNFCHGQDFYLEHDAIMRVCTFSGSSILLKNFTNSSHSSRKPVIWERRGLCPSSDWRRLMHAETVLQKWSFPEVPVTGEGLHCSCAGLGCTGNGRRAPSVHKSRVQPRPSAWSPPAPSQHTQAAHRGAERGEAAWGRSLSPNRRIPARPRPLAHLELPDQPQKTQQAGSTSGGGRSHDGMHLNGCS